MAGKYIFRCTGRWVFIASKAYILIESHWEILHILLFPLSHVFVLCLPSYVLCPLSYVSVPCLPYSVPYLTHISVPCLPSAVPSLTSLFFVSRPLSPVSLLCSLSPVLCTLSLSDVFPVSYPPFSIPSPLSTVPVSPFLCMALFHCSCPFDPLCF
jgi:hypothetical protein